MSVLADDASVSEALEAECRKRMAELAHMPARGWDTQNARAKILAELDGLLDDWLAAH